MLPLQGNRWYYFDENMVCLTDENVTILKSMGTRKNLDSKFVSVLLSAVFGDDVLCAEGKFGRGTQIKFQQCLSSSA